MIQSHTDTQILTLRRNCGSDTEMSVARFVILVQTLLSESQSSWPGALLLLTKEQHTAFSRRYWGTDRKRMMIYHQKTLYSFYPVHSKTEIMASNTSVSSTHSSQMYPWAPSGSQALSESQARGRGSLASAWWPDLCSWGTALLSPKDGHGSMLHRVHHLQEIGWQTKVRALAAWSTAVRGCAPIIGASHSSASLERSTLGWWRGESVY